MVPPNPVIHCMLHKIHIIYIYSKRHYQYHITLNISLLYQPTVSFNNGLQLTMLHINLNMYIYKASSLSFFFLPFFQFYMLERSHFPHSPLKINTSGLNMTTHICIYVCKTKALSLNVLVFTVIIAAAGKILSIESVWGFL